MPGYYDEQFDPWVKGIRNIGTMIAQQPMMRARSEQLRQDSMLNQARIGTEGAQAEHYRAGTGKLLAETDTIKATEGRIKTLGDSVAPYVQSLQEYQSAVQGGATPEVVEPLKQKLTIADAMFQKAWAMNKDTKLGDLDNHAAKLLGQNAIVSSAGKSPEDQMRMGSMMMRGGTMPPATSAGTTEQANQVNKDRGPRDSTPEGSAVKLRYLYGELSRISKQIRDNNDTSIASGSASRNKLRNEAKTIQAQIDALEGGGQQLEASSPRKLGSAVASAPMANQPQDPDDPSEVGSADDESVEPPAAAAPAAVQPAPRNPAERVKNQTYNTPKGPMTWTGTGWLPAQ